MANAVSYKSFFLSLSLLLDKGNKDIADHQLRTAFIAWKIGEQCELNLNQLSNLIIGALVHDIGAIDLEEKSDIYLTKYEDIDVHSYKGWYILQKVPNFLEVANAVKYHHRSYKELGDTYLLSQIINISDNFERLIRRDKNILEQKDEILDILIKSQDLHPKLKNILSEISEPEEFWFDLEDNNLLLHFNEAPISEKIVSKEVMISLAFLIKDIVDFKSPFTVAHSNAVMYCAYTMGMELGYDEDDLDDLVLAGLFHDVGKLMIPTSIIMKNGPLTKLEQSIMKQHPYYTYRFLKIAGYSKQIYFGASTHHEGLDGKGYPFRFGDKKLSEFEKLMAVCDVFVALTEDRPYRKGLSKDSVEKILLDMTGSKLDGKYVGMILEVYDKLIFGMKEILTIYQIEYNDFIKILDKYKKNPNKF